MNQNYAFRTVTSSTDATERGETVWLRLLATSDLHAHLRAYDYAGDRAVEDWGLSRTASLIAQARAEATSSILLDNGDFLQGTPLADLAVQPSKAPLTVGEVHPVIKAMNLLRYDVIGLGNHEFNYGLDTLRAAIRGSNAPVICANALTEKAAHASGDRTLLPAEAFVERRVTHPKTGQQHVIKIGVMAILPTQIMTWDGHHLSAKITTRDMVETVSMRVPMMKAAGADLIVLLAHTGIDTEPFKENMEQAAVTLARIPGVDAIIAGHSHEVFPNDETHHRTGVDRDSGTFHGVPAVMPGYRGSHLGVIDLFLSNDGAGWRVKNHRSEARAVADPPNGSAPEEPGLVAAIEAMHSQTLQEMSRPLSQSSAPIHSYLSLVRSDKVTRLIAGAKREAVNRILADSPFANLPVLSTAAPYQCGGRAGPGAYVDIAAGPLNLRAAAALYPFPNTLCAAMVTGAELIEWLECAASCFRQIAPGAMDQTLFYDEFPSHAVDTIDGLRYEIDLSAPPRIDAHGAPHRDYQVGTSRIKALTFEGRAVGPDDMFVLAMNNYRAFGGGPYPKLQDRDLIIQSTTLVREVIEEFLRDDGLDRVNEDAVWRLKPIPNATAVFETGPGLRAYPEDIAALGLQELGTTSQGFLRMRMPLDRAACESVA